MSAAVDYKGRRLKTSHRTVIRQRHNSEEDAVPLDSSKSLAANVNDILRDVVAPTGVLKGRKLGQLNNFVKIVRTVFSRNVAQSRAFSKPNSSKSKGASSSTSTSAKGMAVKKGEEIKSWNRVFGLSPEDLVACLVVGLLCPQSEVRAATLRAFRYLFTLSTSSQLSKRDVDGHKSPASSDYLIAFNSIKLDLLIARCLDIYEYDRGCREKESERVQALRLVKRIAILAASEPANQTINESVSAENASDSFSNSTSLTRHHSSFLPESIVRSLVAIGCNYSPSKDETRLSCLSILCELAVTHREVSVRCGVVPALLEAVLDTTCPRSVEAMLHAVLYLLNNTSSSSVAYPLNSDVDGFRLNSSFSRSDESDSTTSTPTLFVNLDLLIAPLTDLNYKHLADSLIAAPATGPAGATGAATTPSDSSLSRTERVEASCHALWTLLRSWPGIAHFCGGGDGTAVKSLVGVLHAPNREMTKSVVDLLFGVFDIPLPPEGEEDLLKAVGFIADPSRFSMRSSWRISSGYVAEEGLDILPCLAETRPDLLVNHLSIVLSVFIEAGLLDAVVDTILSEGCDDVRRLAVCLLAQLLHLSNTCLPADRNLSYHSLPSLMKAASPLGDDLARQYHARSAISALEHFHKIKTTVIKPIPHSLQLLLILTKNDYYSPSTREESYFLGLSNDAIIPYLSGGYSVSGFGAESRDDAIARATRATEVLVGRDPITWKWAIVVSLLKWSVNSHGEEAAVPYHSPEVLHSINLSGVGGRSLGGAAAASSSSDFTSTLPLLDLDFIKRLIHFFKPSSNQFSAISSGREDSNPMAAAGVLLVEYLAEFSGGGGGGSSGSLGGGGSGGGGSGNSSGGDDLSAAREVMSRFLEEFLSEFAACVAELTYAEKSPLDMSLGCHAILNTFVRYYFVMVGTLSYSEKGMRFLEKTGVFQAYLDLLSTPHGCHETYVKLIVSSLNFQVEGLPRVIIDKILSSSSEANRLYVLRMLRVLLRARVKYFSNWGLKILVTLLCDPSPRVSSEALEFLDEACEDKVHLLTLVDLQPSVLHLGEKGRLLLARYASVPRGLKYLREAGFINPELQAWEKSFHFRYVDLVEDLLNAALTSYDPVALHVSGTYGRRSYVQQHQRQSKGNRTTPPTLPQRPPAPEHVYIPTHLYGQLSQHREGFKCLEESVDLERLFNIIEAAALAATASECEDVDRIRSASMSSAASGSESCQSVDERALKAALWAIGHAGSSAWGVMYLIERNAVGKIVILAEESPSIPVRGTAFYVLGLITSTRQGANLLNRYGWRSLKSTWSSQWRPIPHQTVEPGCSINDPAKTGVTLGEAIMKESNMIDAARSSAATASTLFNYKSESNSHLQSLTTSQLDSLPQLTTHTGINLIVSDESPGLTPVDGDGNLKSMTLFRSSSSNPTTPSRIKNGAAFGIDSGSSSKSSTLERQRGSTDPTFVRRHSSKTKEGLFQRRWNSLPHKKLKERLGSGKSTGSENKATGVSDGDDGQNVDDSQNQISTSKSLTMNSSKSAQGFAMLERRRTIDASPPTTLQPSLHTDSIFKAVVELPSPQEPPQPSSNSHAREKDVGGIIRKCPLPSVSSKPRSSSSGDAVEGEREGSNINSIPAGSCFHLSKTRFSADVLGPSLLPSPSSCISNAGASPNNAAPSTPSSGPLAIVSAEEGGRWRADSGGSGVTSTDSSLSSHRDSDPVNSFNSSFEVPSTKEAESEKVKEGSTVHQNRGNEPAKSAFPGILKRPMSTVEPMAHNGPRIIQRQATFDRVIVGRGAARGNFTIVGSQRPPQSLPYQRSVSDGGVLTGGTVPGRRGSENSWSFISGASSSGLTSSNCGSKSSIDSALFFKPADLNAATLWQARIDAGLRPLEVYTTPQRAYGEDGGGSSLIMDPLQIAGFDNPSSCWSARDEAGLAALKSLQRSRAESNRLIEDILEQKSETRLLQQRSLVRKLSSKTYGPDLQFDIDPVSGVYLGPSDTEAPIGSPSSSSTTFVEDHGTASSVSLSSVDRRPHGASFVVSPDVSRLRSRSNQRVEDHNAATLVTSGLFYSGNDVGAGTAEYVGVSLPFTVRMILTLPGTRRGNSYSLPCEEMSEDPHRVLVEEDDDDVGRVEANDESSVFSLARRVGIATPPVPSADVDKDASTPPKEFLLGLPKATKTGSSVPAQSGSLLLPGAGSFRGSGLAAPKSLVTSSFAPRGRSDAGFYRAIASQVRGDRMERRSSTDADDALDAFQVGLSSTAASDSTPSSGKEKSGRTASGGDSTGELIVHSESDCIICCRKRRRPTAASSGSGSSPSKVGKAAGRDPAVWKEILRLVTNLSSSVGVKGNQAALGAIKNKFPHLFRDPCLYSEVSLLLAQSTYRLHVRKFVQDAFNDISFESLVEVAGEILSRASADLKDDQSSPSSTSSPETELSLASNSETNTIIAEVV